MATTRSKPSASREKRNLFQRIDDAAMDRMPIDFQRMHHAEREVIKPDTTLVRRKPAPRRPRPVPY